MKNEHALINLFQRLMNRLDRIEEKDWYELQELSSMVVIDFEEGVLSWNREMGYKKFKLTLERLASEEEISKKLILEYQKELNNQGQDFYDHNIINIRECWAVIETTISELLVLVIYNYPEKLRNKPAFRKRILERLQHSPKKERARQNLMNIAKEDDSPQELNKNLQPEEIRLEFYFESINKYKKIMEILVNNDLIQEHTYLWKDDGKANKKLLVSLLKHLHSQGYYKNNQRLSTKEIQGIAANSFGWEIGEDTIKKTKASSFPYKFIPPSSTVV